MTARAKGNFNYNACYRMCYLWSQSVSRLSSKCLRCKGSTKRLITKGIWHILYYLAQWGILQNSDPFESVWPPLTLPSLIPPSDHEITVDETETEVEEEEETEVVVEEVTEGEEET